MALGAGGGVPPLVHNDKKRIDWTLYI